MEKILQKQLRRMKSKYRMVEIILCYLGFRIQDRSELGSSLAKGIYWVNLLLDDLESTHLVKDCLWEFGCKHHQLEMKREEVIQREELRRPAYIPDRQKNISTLKKEESRSDKLDVDKIWETDQPVMFGFVNSLRSSLPKYDISFNDEEILLATELNQMVSILTD